MKYIFWIIFSKLIVLGLILFSGIPLMPDEAQYWTWSKELSYGYYSKPPGIAWQIAAGCFFFGDTELGVRFGSLLLSTVLSFAVYFLGKDSALDEKKCFWAALSFSYCPLGIFSGFFATTDCAYALFWTLEVAFSPIGLFIALGALWKWPIYLLLVATIFFYYKEPKRVAICVCIALLGIVPSLLWNIKTDFVTFQHVLASVENHSRPNPLEFIGAQFLLVSPLFFALILVAFCKVSKSFAWLSALLLLGGVFVLSCFEKVQGNWAVACFPSAFVIMASYASETWMRRGMWVSILLLIALFIFPIPYRMNPFRTGLGANCYAQVLADSGYNPERDFLFSDRYQEVSLLSFYGPEKKRAYFFNINSLRHNQYDLWPQMAEKCAGKNGYFLETSSPQDALNHAKRFQEKLSPYFEEVSIMPPQYIYKDQKMAIVLFCKHYNGKNPPKINKY